MRRGGGDGNELMTEIESERGGGGGGGEIDILSSPEPQAWSPATVPDGLTERGKREMFLPLVSSTITEIVMVLKYQHQADPKSQRPFTEADHIHESFKLTATSSCHRESTV